MKPVLAKPPSGRAARPFPAVLSTQFAERAIGQKPSHRGSNQELDGDHAHRCSHLSGFTVWLAARHAIPKNTSES
jgi:hypothetical protein